ncbi:hypothetical protein SKAU_G00071160 [Synaphobranchus kaupii]|uniref:Serpin domain-containing protein n=1 Tax=Synaphobranchus kaupii TaxID=118154 RepID=A0A9Q1G7Q7_SYNKA|nr:hypothetical protein SKAU_G00071160 [Synaphobranchus kaupii]
MESLVASNTKFSLDLFKNITEKKKTDNIFYSPISISSALAMVYMGARGNTASQMSEERATVVWEKELSRQDCPSH